MNRFFWSILFAVTCVSVKGQDLFFDGYFSGEEIPVYGAFISDTLTNTGTLPATFYFNYQVKDSFGVNRSEVKKMFLNDSSFVNWLFQKGESVYPQARLIQYVKALAWFYKSNRNFRNYLNIAQPESFVMVDSGFAKMTALNGSNASFHNQQCGDFVHHALRSLYLLWSYGIDTAACNPAYYREVSIPGRHTVFEVWYNSKWAMVDVDPGTAGFMFSNGQGGYYSVQDLVDDPARAYANWTFLNDDNSVFEMPESDSVRSTEYRAYFNGQPVYSATYDLLMQFRSAGNSVSGKVIIPAQGSLVFSYANNALTIDLSKPENRLVYQAGKQFYYAYATTGNQVYLDSMVNLLATSFTAIGISQSVAADVVSRNALGLSSGKWMPCFEQGPTEPAILTYYVESGADTLIIGRDVAGPFMVMAVQTNKPITIGGSTIVDSMRVQLWTGSLTGGPTNLDNRKVNYLTSGFIPPYTKCRIDVAYNQGYLDWWNGYSIDQLSQADTLTLRRTQNVETYNPTTAISDITQHRQSVAIRLTADQLRQMFPQCSSIVNVSGQSIPVNSHLPAGLYFINSGATAVRLIIVE